MTVLKDIQEILEGLWEIYLAASGDHEDGPLGSVYDQIGRTQDLRDKLTTMLGYVDDE